MTFEGAAGEHRLQLRVRGQVEGRDFQQEQAAVVTVVPALRLSFDPTRVDVDQRRLRFSLDARPSFVELSLYGLNGELMHRVGHEVEGAEPNRPVDVTWPEQDQTIARMALRVFSSDDSWAEAEWRPVQVEIPHPPILFQAGRWAIAASERAKLDEAYSAATAELAKYPRTADLRLYVLGLGGAEPEAKLLHNRAKAAAKYLKRKGLRIPVFAAAAEPGSVDLSTDGAQAGVLSILASDAPTQGNWKRVR